MCNTCIPNGPAVLATVEGLTAKFIDWSPWKTYPASRNAWRERALMVGQLSIASIYEHDPAIGCRHFTVGHRNRGPFPVKYCCYADALAALKELLP